MNAISSPDFKFQPGQWRISVHEYSKEQYLRLDYGMRSKIFKTQLALDTLWALPDILIGNE